MYTMGVLGHFRERHACEYLNASMSGEVDEGGIEIATRRNCRKEASWGKGEAQLATGRRAKPSLADFGPVAHSGWVESEKFEFAQSKSGQTVATALVAWKCGLVDQRRCDAVVDECDGCGNSSRTRSDDDCRS
jgi:hypothetical protein